MSLMRGKRAIKKEVFKKLYDPQFRNQRKLNAKQARQVKRIINRKSELKYIVANSAPSSITTTVGINTIMSIAVGQTDSTRIGDKVILTKIEGRMHFTNTGDATNFVRVILFQWKESTVPTAADILLAGSSGTQDVGSLYAHDTRSQFKILYDKILRLVGNAAAATTPNTDLSILVLHPIIFGKKLLPNIQFIAGSSTVCYNSVYLLTVSDSTAAPHPSIYSSYKLNYRDM